MGLKDYQRKRKFRSTPEPKGKVQKGKDPLRFVVQMHAASRLHFDFRLEMGGVLKSWAVPKGPSLNPLDQRLAVFVEDHPLDYGDFEGIIPSGNYGAGTVMVWDNGTYDERSAPDRKQAEKNLLSGLAKGHITFILNGQKLKGEFALIKLKKDTSDKSWLLVKKRDEFASYKRTGLRDDLSLKTGRTMDEIAGNAGAVWHSHRKIKKTSRPTPAAKKPIAKKPDAMPRKIRPMLALAGGKVTGTDWLREPDPDGTRAIAEVEARHVHLYSKGGLSLDNQFPEVLIELKKQKQVMILDGEVAGSVYYVYDILYEDGRDLRKSPLAERKKILDKSLLRSLHVKPVSEFSKTKQTVAKAKKSLYRSGISNNWVKSGQTGEKSRAKAAVTNDLRLTHLNKIYFPEERISKGDLIEYYHSVAPLILPYLIDRPESMNRHPNGIQAAGFYQKDMTGHIPRWLKTKRIHSESAGKSIDYVLCQDERSLLYLANLGCIELNPWFSRVQHLDKPDFLVIDLDPDENDFREVIDVALEVHAVLNACGAANFVKTSGATGIHIGVPTGARYDYDKARKFAEAVCRVVEKKLPTITSVERNPNRRRKKIYLDFLQNRRGQTLAAPLCVRPREGAPVSMPLKWKDLTPHLKPEQFHIGNALRRVQRFGDSWKPVLGKPIALEACFRELRKKFASAG